MSGAVSSAELWVAVATLGLSIVGSAVAVAFRLGRAESTLESLRQDVSQIENGSLDRDYRTDVDRRLTKLEAGQGDILNRLGRSDRG